MHLRLKDVTSDLSEPIGLELNGTLKRQGQFDITGTVVPALLEAKVRIATEALDLAAMDSYMSDMLNVTISSAALTMNGELALTTTRGKLGAKYRGDATLGNVRMLDRMTSEKCHELDLV